MKLNEFMSIGNGVLCIKYDKLCKGEKKSVDAVCIALNDTKYDEKIYCVKVENNNEILLEREKELRIPINCVCLDREIEERVRNFVMAARELS
ncbi:hypothetical protein BFU36_12060 [Sulfolobus sp. A20]|uniref:hypothetical protein n=1 Tax=Saccharolobus sp. A20 TaxID=1891280 RepID=UPI0008461C19|nr:hypothetical protein [Sulfolobus sp. A20]TRM74440.1 hypothetical protein DJ532_12830 [Sulfolobus sp. A20-N-F8]TRM75536.1 hypothetical protein DJ528_09260 [Sulfolobus sp. B5]TRM80143.1 hypothetical protein DJ531_12650 [Sulfolobus sp. A20-N-F6]TRM84419.1 hypothetical protein DJ522_04840 [Sulfolobus sp. F3]TRM86583.1 hypothetical protein DJ529_10940 [Sulfolobus sp. C3]TRM86695.1 hypothetical protein DJ521_05035 [Sulfolobus sp. E3]TRM99025.1 hypothetical protein DJ527_09410 [Sulfolobus sp. F1